MQPARTTVPTHLFMDRECLAAWRRDPQVEHLRPLVERYLAFVYSSAWRRTGSAEQAAEVSRAVFLALARRARKLSKKTVLAAWLFHVTKVACKKLKRGAFWAWFRYKPRRAIQLDVPLWTRVAPRIDRALDRLWSKKRNAVLLCAFLKYDPSSAAQIVHTPVSRVEKRLKHGLRKLAKRLRHRRAPVDRDELATACVTEGCGAPVPEDLASEILASIAATADRRPTLRLARRTLRTLGWQRWRRRFVVATVTWHTLLAIIGGVVWRVESRSGYSRLIATFVVWSVRFQVMRISEPARPWPTNPDTRRLDARAVRRPQDLYQTTNIWLARLNFTREQWKGLDARYIGAMPNFMRPDGLIFLRNPSAQRSGVAGVLGYEFGWSRGDFEIGGVSFTNVAARVKGNMGSLCTSKPSFKVDLNRLTKGQKLAGLDELTFNNLVWDYSGLHEALGYEFFRDAGVPAPRTAYAWLSATVTERWQRKPLGLYLMLEPVDDEFAVERFGSETTPIFKPVTYNLFEHLGDDWPAYAAIYDLKTEATHRQKQRVIDFARLVSSASDSEFAADVGEFLDLDEFARFLAGLVLLSSYDGILADGQNFYMYLDTGSNKLGFIPWDLDSAWGHFWIGEKLELERASIWHPWIGENRFIERVMAVEEFRRVYRGHLEDFLARLFVPGRLHRRVDELAALIRDPIAAEARFRLSKFERAISINPVEREPGESAHGVNHPPHQLKRFIDARARSVRRQLDGQSKGVILKTPNQK
jgi:DNA-directed RNA polymerase specialized sigma24 family protein